MRKGVRRILVCGMVCGVALLSNAQSAEARRPKSKPAIFVHSGFKTLGINQVTFLPIVDLRTVEEPRNGDGFAARMIRGALNRRDYEIEVIDDEGAWPNGAPTAADLERPSPSWITELGAGRGRWVLLVTIVRLERRITVAATAECELHGYLFDTERGELLWEGAGVATQSVGIFLTKLAEGTALESAGRDLMLSFPQ